MNVTRVLLPNLAQGWSGCGSLPLVDHHSLPVINFFISHSSPESLGGFPSPTESG